MSKESPRAALGLDTAHDGDLNGIRRFSSFVYQELWSISVAPDLPEDVRHRISSLGREAEELVIFLDGYLSARKIFDGPQDTPSNGDRDRVSESSSLS